jgi:outer membrane protein OmpA-like peptidoglycan-associated protein
MPQFFERTLMLDSEAQDDIYFLLGKAYHYDHQFDKAIDAFFTFIDKAPTRIVNQYYDDVQRRISEAKYAKQLVESPVNVVIYPLNTNINSMYPDYCPVITPEGDYMLFTARRSSTVGGGRDAKDFKYNEDIYESYRVDGEWQPAQNTNLMFNNKSHDATVGISADGKRMLIYKGDKGGDIWESIQVNNEWKEPYKLNNTVNTKYQETSASYSPDGKLLYFVSDRPDGIGGKDIYVSEIQPNGLWGKAKNMGSVINTPMDEEAVFIAADGTTMYFSSKGHMTMGGYDIFKSELVDGNWTEPVNLGYPINTADDDIFFVVDSKGEYAYYSSERAEGAGSQDIYAIQFIMEEMKQQIILNARLVDEIFNEPLDMAYLEVLDAETGEIIASFEHIGEESHLFDMELEAGKTYLLLATSPGYHNISELLYVEKPETNFEIVEKDIPLGLTNMNSLILPIVYFDFDQHNLRAESVEDINQVISILKKYPYLHLEISGHTDIIGNWDYNVWLSKKRSYEVANYITEAGIDQNRLHLVWYSFDLPAAENKSDEGRQLNRRTEFRLISK